MDSRCDNPHIQMLGGRMAIANSYSNITIKEVINNNFTFADLSPKYKGVDSSTGNIFCPFHENHETPAAKMYWDNERNIWILHCFGECHRNYTAYDYVQRILCDKYRKYLSPLDFLKSRMPETVLSMQLDIYQKQTNELMETTRDKKVTYINNIFDETGNITDFIEKLYTS